MTTRSTLITCLASIAMLAFASTASAAQQQPGVLTAKQAQSTTAAAAVETMTVRERTQLSRALTGKWGKYVQSAYDVPAGVWTSRMASTLSIADASNLRSAMQRDTFEGAMAELNGTGAKMNDNQVIDALAASGGGASPQALGALTNDLVYTPVAPCRILDTRVAGGTIAANATRNFVAFGVSSFASQGGSATNCGVNPLAATAVAINLTAVTPALAGFATAYPFGTTQPVASSINYTAGAIVNNALIVQTPNPIASFDFTLFTFAQSHYVADIVGYFAPPVATALQCQDTVDVVVSVAAGATGNAFSTACPTGFTTTGTNCEASSWDVPMVFINNGTCSARNNGAGAANIRASRTCCRVPGR